MPVEPPPDLQPGESHVPDHARVTPASALATLLEKVERAGLVARDIHDNPLFHSLRTTASPWNHAA
jgi:hypothetical protein